MTTPSADFSAIRAITFDWGDTLAVNFGMPYQATQRAALDRLAHDLRACGCTVPTDWRERVLADIAQHWKASIDPLRNPDHREIDMMAMMQAWLAWAGADVARPEVCAAADRCNDRFTDTVLPFHETRRVLAELKTRGYRIGVLSHVPWPGDACRRWFVRHGLADVIDFYSLSCEIGWIKPNHAHYRDALTQAGCAAHEVLHVGDHPMRDVQGGKAFGFRTCLRWTENVYPQETLAACGADCEILHLADLLDVV
jgi:FMN phosphatase YigB (HAD superfamily)